MPEVSWKAKSADGCTYFFCRPENRWYKFHPVDALPADVADWVDRIKREAGVLKDAACLREE